jgi:ABC-2 type transport system permease protein
LRRNRAAAVLAIHSQLEYRINFLIDAVIQPCLNSIIVATLWMAIITGMGFTQLGGFGREYYLAYALWAIFVGRVTSNWMYEFNMLDDIDTGKVNSILVRPISFYEFYLSQFVGYKSLTFLTSFLFPVIACKIFHAPVILSRLPGMVALVLFYLIFVHTLSFCVACLGFFINRAQSFTMVKNLAIWVLAGEMIPLDLYPEPFRSLLIHAPFSSGVYIPVGYVTGRVSAELFAQSFLSVAGGILVMGFVAVNLWRRGVHSYTGTGA